MGKIVKLTARPRDVGAPAPVVRGPHADRSASMQQRLINAAIDCLHTVSYAATTTQKIIEVADVSRGAFLHHYPNKVDLIIAVAEYSATFQNAYVDRRVRDFDPGMARYMALTTATWEVIRQPPAQALLEIIMASRSDPALAERLPPVIARFEAEQRAGVWRMAAKLGIRDHAKLTTMSRLHVAAMRGIAIELRWSGDAAAAEESMHLLNHYKRIFTGELLTENYGVETRLED
ncbi:MAG: TetR/AcrR family transcriptional regulator [Alphaproteobacteria bacterium]